MKILIINQPTGNYGDLAAMEILFGRLKQKTDLDKFPINTTKETQFTIFDYIEC